MTRIRRSVLPPVALIFALAVSTGVSGRQQSASPDARMGKAQQLEEVEGNLSAAIATYRTVADDPKAPRALAAGALLQIGRLHERLGSREATRAYERIAKDFADQPTAVAEAQRRLAALGGGSNSPGHGGIVARQVWAGREADPFGSVSADGRFYAFVDWLPSGTGNLAVRDLASGDVRRLTTASTAAEGNASEPAWSADGKRIAYVWSGPSVRSSVVRVVAADGSGSRDIFRRQDTYPSGLTWSPDGRVLAASLANFGKEVTAEVVLLAVETGAILRSRPAGTTSGSLGGFSPDGRHLAFGVDAPPGGQGGLHLLPVDGGDETTLLTGPGTYAHPIWSPDGRDLIFLSDRSGAPGLWTMAVRDARAAGQPRLVKPNTGPIVRLAISRNRTLWYGLVTMTSDVYTCDYDPEVLSCVSTPTAITDRLVGANSGPAWAPGGRDVAFMRGTDRRKRVVVVRNIDTGAERELPASFTDTVHASNWGPTWLPDGLTLLVSDVNFATSRFTIHELSVDGGPARIAFEGDFNTAWPHVRVSPDGRSLFYTRRDRTPSVDRSTLLLVRRDRTSGAETELYRAPSLGAVGFFGLAVSPDGRHVAFSQNIGEGVRALMMVPTAGGDARELYRGTYSMPQPVSGAWTPDSRHVLVVGRDADAPLHLWAVPVDGGKPRQAGLSRRGGISAASLSPDGRRLTFAGNDREGELWAVSNLLETPAADGR